MLAGRGVGVPHKNFQDNRTILIFKATSPARGGDVARHRQFWWELPSCMLLESLYVLLLMPLKLYVCFSLSVYLLVLIEDGRLEGNRLCLNCCEISLQNMLSLSLPVIYSSISVISLAMSLCRYVIIHMCVFLSVYLFISLLAYTYLELSLYVYIHGCISYSDAVFLCI